MKARRLSRLFLPGAVAALLANQAVHAATHTFTVPDAFTTGSGNWSTDTKWDTVPVSGSDTSLIFTLQATGNSQTQTTGAVNDIVTGNPNNAFQLNTMTFNSNPSAGNGSLIVALNISGNPLDFVSNGLITPVINLNGNRTNGQPVQFNVANNVTLGTGTLFTGNGTATFNFSGIVSGNSGFTKSGTSTLTLSNGSNDFTGGVTLSAGGLALGDTAALGNNTVSVTGNSTISATSGTISNTINITDGVTLGLRNIGATNSTATFSSAITGAVGITLVQGAASGTTVALSSTNNTFTGNLTLPGGTGANDFISFNSIGNGGSIVFNRSSWRSAATYTGSTNLNLTTRSISLATTFGGATGLDGGGSPINMFANSGDGVVTIAPDMVMTTTASSGYFFFGGTNTGNNTFSGLIADPTNASTLGIGKWDAGKWILSNANNSFEGNILLGGGTLSAAAISNAGVAQALGQGSLIQLGQGGNSGTLEITGATNSATDKQIVLGSNNNNHAGQGGILNNGNGTLIFTNPIFNSITQNSGLTTRDRTLTLGGSNTGANEIQGTIQDHNTVGADPARVLLTKTDAGRWVLSGDNTYTGATNVNGGTLLINGNASTAVGAVTVASAGTLGGIGTVGGATTVNGTLSPGQSPGTLTFAGNLTINNNANYLFESGDLTDVNGTLDLNDNWILTLSGAGFQDGGMVTLFEYTSLAATPDLTPTINLLNLGFTPSGGLTLTDTGSSIVLNGVSVVPEPRAALLGAIGLLMLLRRRR